MVKLMSPTRGAKTSLLYVVMVDGMGGSGFGMLCKLYHSALG